MKKVTARCRRDNFSRRVFLQLGIAADGQAAGGRPHANAAVYQRESIHQARGRGPENGAGVGRPRIEIAVTPTQDASCGP